VQVPETASLLPARCRVGSDASNAPAPKLRIRSSARSPLRLCLHICGVAGIVNNAAASSSQTRPYLDLRIRVVNFHYCLHCNQIQPHRRSCSVWRGNHWFRFGTDQASTVTRPPGHVDNQWIRFVDVDDCSSCRAGNPNISFATANRQLRNWGGCVSGTPGGASQISRNLVFGAGPPAKSRAATKS